MTDVGEIVVRIRADAAQLEREMNRSRTVMEQAAGRMKTAFSGVTDALKGFHPDRAYLDSHDTYKHAD